MIVTVRKGVNWYRSPEFLRLAAQRSFQRGTENINR